PGTGPLSFLATTAASWSTSMGFLTALRIAGSALTAERLRTDVIANNVANMNTTRTAEGGPYKRQQVVFGARQQGTQSTFRSILMNHGLGGTFGPAGPA